MGTQLPSLHENSVVLQPVSDIVVEYVVEHCSASSWKLQRCGPKSNEPADAFTVAKIDNGDV